MDHGQLLTRGLLTFRSRNKDRQQSHENREELFHFFLSNRESRFSNSLRPCFLRRVVRSFLKTHTRCVHLTSSHHARCNKGRSSRMLLIFSRLRTFSMSALQADSTRTGGMKSRHFV